MKAIKNKKSNLRKVLSVIISIILGYVFSSQIFFYSKVWLLPQKNIVASFYILSIIIFSILVYRKISKMDFKKKDKKKLSSSKDIDYTWEKK